VAPRAGVAGAGVSVPATPVGLGEGDGEGLSVGDGLASATVGGGGAGGGGENAGGGGGGGFGVYTWARAIEERPRKNSTTAKTARAELARARWRRPATFPSFVASCAMLHSFTDPHLACRFHENDSPPVHEGLTRLR
jgi:hypothetical protein